MPSVELTDTAADARPGLFLGLARAVSVSRLDIASLAVLSASLWIGWSALVALHRLLWRFAEVGNAASSLTSIVGAHPVRVAVALFLCIGATITSELRPRLVRATMVVVLLGVGWTAGVVYLLAALNVAYEPIVRTVVASALIAIVAAVIVVNRRVRELRQAEEQQRSFARRLLPACGIGLVCAIVVVRASLEPVTEWDAVIYHASFARDWALHVSSLPHAAGPSLGAELSYSYPVLFPSVAVAASKGLGLPVVDTLRWISPLALLAVVCALRIAQPTRRRNAWTAPALLLGTGLIVSYAEWPTTYLLLVVLLVFAWLELRDGWQTSSRSARNRGFALIGLAAVCGTFGLLVAAGTAGVWGILGGGRRLLGRRTNSGSKSEAKARSAFSGLWLVTLISPTLTVVVASLERTHGLFFPWVTWPGAAHLLPADFWKAAQDEILNNSYGALGSNVGAFVHPFRVLVSSSLLVPGGTAAALGAVFVVAAACGRTPAVRLAGAAVAILAGVAVLVAVKLVWYRYFLPVAPVAALLFVEAAELVRGSRASAPALRIRKVLLGAPRHVLVIVAAACAVSGAVQATAGPNDSTWTLITQYAAEHVSPFESASTITDTAARLRVVYGDDARAWQNINDLLAGGRPVGTFDVRNWVVPYQPQLQLDGLAGSRIRERSRPALVAALLRAKLDAVFVPSWFWDPTAAASPLASWSPIIRWVGAPGLRAARVYLPDRTVQYPSVLYSVGGRTLPVAGPRISVAGPVSMYVAVGAAGFSFDGMLGGWAGWLRLASPTGDEHGLAVRINVRTPATGPALSIYEPANPTLFEPVTVPACGLGASHGLPAVVDVIFPGSLLGFSELDMSTSALRRVTGTAEELTGHGSRPFALVHACGDPTSTAGGVFTAGSTASRVMVENRGSSPLSLVFSYKDTGTTPVSFNAYDYGSSTWTYNVGSAARCGSGAWLTGSIPVPFAGNQQVELGPYVRGRSLQLRDLHVADADTARVTTASACGDPRTAGGWVFLAGDTASRIDVESRGARTLTLAFSYKDSGTTPVSFNAYDYASSKWLYNVASLNRCGTGDWITTHITVSTGGSPHVELGPYLTGQPLRVRDLRVVPDADAKQAPTTCSD